MTTPNLSHEDFASLAYKYAAPVRKSVSVVSFS